MEAFNAASILTPLSVFSNRTTQHLRNFSSPPTISASKVTNFSGSSTKKPRCLQECLSGGLLLAASPAAALTYEEALGQSLSSPGSSFPVEFDANGVVESVLTFASENPLVIGGAVAFLAVPLVLSQVLRKPNKAWGVESAKNAYAKLGADGNAELVDIRGAVEVRKVGVPDVGGLGKKSVSIAYKGDDKPGFLKKLALKFKEPENTTLFILDKFNGNSELVAELVTVNGFKAAYAIKDGAEGPRGWMNSGLPWIAPRKTFSLDFGNLTDALGDTSDGLVVILGIAATTGLGLLVFSEIETILQVLGSVALVQFASKLLFAEERKQTLQQVDEFLSTKVAPAELVDDIKQIGMAFLPASINSKTLPAPADTASESKVDAVAAGPAPGTNLVPKAEIKDESLPVLPRSLSPYPYYSDFKPPTSPTPSQPKIKYAADTASSSQVVPAAAGPAPEVNSVPKTEIKDESLLVLPRSLSPYPYYSDFKPPTPPTPSQP